MNMNITIQFNKVKGSIPNSSWIDSNLSLIVILYQHLPKKFLVI